MLSAERQKYHYVEQYDAEYFLKNARVITIQEALATKGAINDKWHKPERVRKFLSSLGANPCVKEAVVCAQFEKEDVWYGTLYVVVEAGHDADFKRFIGSTRMAPQEFDCHGSVLGNPVYRLWWD